MKSSQACPDFVALELTNYCQLRCKGCFSGPEDYPKGHMDFDFYKSIVDRMNPEKMRLNPYANGEPLLYPRIFEAIQYATERGIKNYITTNGMLWNEGLFRYTLEHPEQCYQLVVSVDGLKARKSRSIETCRPGSDRDKIHCTIEGLIDLKHRLGSKTDVMVKMCERGQDYEEQEEFLDYWLRYGADVVIVGRLFESYDQDSLRIYPCQYSDPRFMLIRWDGTARMCMYHPKVMNGGMLPIGKLDWTTPLLDFYNNEAYRTFREQQAAGVFPPPCDRCGISYTGAGHRGVLFLRDRDKTQKPIFFRGDHYNTFYSFVDKGKPDSCYGYQP